MCKSSLVLLALAIAVTNASPFGNPYGQQSPYGAPQQQAGYGKPMFGGAQQQQFGPAKPPMGGYTPMSMSGMGPLGGGGMGGMSGMGGMGNMGGLSAMMGGMGGMGGMMGGMGGMGAMGGSGGMQGVSPFAGLLQQIQQQQQEPLSFGRSYKMVPDMPAQQSAGLSQDYDDEEEYEPVPKRGKARKTQVSNDYDDADIDLFNQMSVLKTNQQQQQQKQAAAKNNNRKAQALNQNQARVAGNARNVQKSKNVEQQQAKTLKSSNRPSSIKQQAPIEQEVADEIANQVEQREAATTLKNKNNQRNQMFDGHYNWKYDGFRNDNMEQEEEQEDDEQQFEHITKLSSRFGGKLRNQNRDMMEDVDLSYAIVPKSERRAAF